MSEHDDERFKRLARAQNAVADQVERDVARTRQMPCEVQELINFAVEASPVEGGKLIRFSLPNGRQVLAKIQPRIAAALARELEAETPENGSLEIPGS